MRGPLDLEQLLVLRAGGLGERILGHVQAVGLAARDHQQWLVDEFDLVGGIPTHQVQQAAHGVLEGRAGVRVGLPVVVVTLPVQIKRQLGDLLVCQIGISRIENIPAGHLVRAGYRSSWRGQSEACRRRSWMVSSCEST